MNRFHSFRIAGKVLPFVFILIMLKLCLIWPVSQYLLGFQCVELSEIGVIFTGGFFVMGMMLAGTLSDLKESEKIPGELATNLEILKENILDDVDSNQQERLVFLSLQVNLLLSWLKDKGKHSKEIFDVLDNIRENLKPINQDFDRRFYDQLTSLRRVINRTYVISRTTFAQPAYVLQKSIVGIISVLLLLCQFKTFGGALIVTFALSFVFYYLLYLVKELDDPFLSLKDRTYVDSKAIENILTRIEESRQKIELRDVTKRQSV